MTELFFPPDELAGRRIDVDLAADYLELTAFFAKDDTALASDLAPKNLLRCVPRRKLLAPSGRAVRTRQR